MEKVFIKHLYSLCFYNRDEKRRKDNNEKNEVEKYWPLALQLFIFFALFSYDDMNHSNSVSYLLSQNTQDGRQKTGCLNTR